LLWGSGMTKKISVRRRLLYGASALVLALAALPLVQAGQASAQAAQPSRPRSWQFDIPAKPLLAALADFTALTGVQVVRSSQEALAGSAAQVTGTLTAAEALSRLLAGTGLSARFTSASTAVLSRPGEATRPVGVAPDGSEELDPIDVTANVPPADAPYATPGPVSFISGEQIERLPPTSVGDIFRDTPGVIASGNRIGASVDLNIRGLQGQNRVNVMVDGTRQTGSSYRGYRGSRNEVYIDPDFIGGVDINKGPYGGAGGVGAMGGVVNMRTIEAGDILRPDAEYGARLKGSLGSNTATPPPAGSYDYETSPPGFFNGDAWSGSVATGVKKENYEFIAAASRRKAGNYFVGTNGADSFLDNRIPGSTPVERALSPIKPGWEAFNTSQDVTSFLAKGKVSWGDAHALELGYIYYNNNYGDYNETLLSFVGHPTIITPYEQFALAETTTNTFTSKYTYDPGSDYINFTAHVWASDVETYSEVLKDFAGAPDGDGKSHIRTYGGDAANISLFDTPLGQLRVNNGVEAVYEMADEKASYYFGLQSKNPNGNRLLLSAFNQSKLEMTGWVALLGGLRYDYYQVKPTDHLSEYPEKEGSRLNPSAGVEFTLAQGLQLYALYTEGWRPPSLRESASLTFSTVLPNPDLKPEISKNAEFGVNFLRDNVFIGGDKLRLKASYFNNNYDNYIIRTRIPNDFYYTWTNIPRAKFVGYELSGSYDAGKFFIEANFTKYTDIQFCGEGGVCSFDVAAGDYGVVTIPPEYSGAITAGIRLFDEALTLGGRAYFFGERYGGYRLLAGAVNAPNYWAANTIVDFFGSYKFNEDITWDFSLENAFDRYYLDPLSTGLLPSPGRTLRTSVSWRF
jgi:hemoglobin/transferrin/lactoferrin receptor protein